ncbi:MAG: TRAP transporter large permease subunit [Rhodobacteraceae bacterium]|nr:TRAP transporter large permease subunit [Paracoccaceae bacterium]
MPLPADTLATPPVAPPPASALTRAARNVLWFLDHVVGAFAVAALLGLVTIVFANVVARYGFGSSFIGALEAARWLFIAVILLGVPLAHRMRTHLVITLLVDALPAPLRRLAVFVADFIVAYATIMLMFGGTTLISVIGGTNVTLQLPQWTPYVAIPISCGLGLIYLALRGLDEAAPYWWQGMAAILAAALVHGLAQDWVAGALRGYDPAAAMGVAFAAALAIGTPVSFAMLFSAFIANFAGDILPPAAVVQNMVNGSSKFLMLAIPFFILAGALMNSGGLTGRLMDFAFSLVGHMRGGLAQVNVVSSGLYAGVSGSSYSDAALGTKLLVPQMVQRGYSAPFACAVTAASATLPNIIPPSIALLILAAAANLSVGKLWLAGVFPGLLMAGLLMGLIYVISVRRGFGGATERAGAAARARALMHAAPVLALALLIIGGIRMGVVTPTEAGVLAVVYAFGLGAVVYRAWTPASLYTNVRTAAVEAALVGFLIGAASPFAFVLVSEQVPQAIAGGLPELTQNTLVMLLLANLLLLAFGMLLDIGAAILILTPLLMPAMVAVGVDPIHFGIVIVVNLMLGGLTPPVGMLAFITSSVSGTPVHHVFQQLLPFLGVLLLALGLITYIPGISLGLGYILDAW